MILSLIAALLFQDDVEKLRKDLEESKKKQAEMEQRLDTLQRQQDDSKSLFDKLFPEKKEKDKEAETIFDEGFWFVGKDDKLRIGTSGQFDGRFFLEHEDGDSNFLVRRARVYATGVLEDKFGYMVMGRWDQLTPNLHFAWLESQHLPWLRLRVGLFKEPFSMEGLHSDMYWDFVERSLGVANFLQLEDIGVMAYGKVWEDRIEYGVGVFNGRGRALENNPEKEFAARIVLAPFHKLVDALDQLYFGFSASVGGQDESLGGAGFSTGAGTRIWSWGAGATVNEDRVRWGLDLEWIHGSFAVRAEYIDVDWGSVVRGAASEEFDGSGWFVEGSWIVTGEDKRRNKPVLPKVSFQPLEGNWGAWEIVARYEALRLDEDVRAAAIATGTDEVHGATLGVNVYFNRHMALKINLQYLRFDDPVRIGSRDNDEEFVLTFRFQFEL